MKIKKLNKIILLTVLCLGIILPMTAQAQVGSNFWTFISGVLRPNVVGGTTFRIPWLGSVGSPCLSISNISGDFATTTCGGFSSSTAASVGSQGYVQFASSTPGFFDGEASFFWDSANNRLGIGTTTPGQQLVVVGSTTIRDMLVVGNAAIPGLASSDRLILNDENGNFSDFSFKVAGTGFPIIGLGSSGGTLASPTISSATGNLGQIKFYGYDGAAYRVGAQITAIANGTNGSGDFPGALVFSTTLDGASSPTNRMWLVNSGNLGIGTSTPATRLQVTGSGGSNPFRVSSSTNVTMFEIAQNGSTTIANLSAASCDVKSDSGSLYCGTDATGAGSGNSAWTIGSGLIYNATSTDLVGIGTTSPSTTLFIQGKGGTNPFAIASSTGLQMLTFTQSGNLGIGSTTPFYGLTVNSSTGFRLYDSVNDLGITSNRGTNNRISIHDDSSDVFLYNGSNGAVNINTLANGSITFTPAGTGSSVFASGNVGIGTTTPQQALVVIGSSTISTLNAANCDVKSTTTGGLFCGTDATGASSGNAAWTIGNGFIFNATSTDLVGIGTSTPYHTLDILGKGGVMPLRISSSTGTSLFEVEQNGFVGIATTSAVSLLSVAGQITGQNFVGYGTATSTFAGPVLTKTVRSKTFPVTAVTSAGDFKFVWKVRDPITIRSVTVIQEGATNVVGQLDWCTAAGSCTAVDSADITATSGEANDDGTLSSPSVAAGNYMGWHTTSVSGTNTRLWVTFTYVDNF